MAEETIDGIRPWMDRLLPLGGHGILSSEDGEMVSQTLTVLYLEKLEGQPNEVQEPHEVWCQ